MTAPKLAEPLKTASKVARSTHLDSVRFLQGSFVVEKLDVEPKDDDGLGSSFSFDMQPSEGRLLSRVSITLEVQQRGAPPLHRVTVKGTIELGYRMTAKFAAEELEAFSRINGIYHAWPYWREFVQSSTTRAGLPPLTLHPIQAPDAMVMAGFAPPPPVASKTKSSG